MLKTKIMNLTDTLDAFEDMNLSDIDDFDSTSEKIKWILKYNSVYRDYIGESYSENELSKMTEKEIDEIIQDWIDTATRYIPSIKEDIEQEEKEELQEEYEDKLYEVQKHFGGKYSIKETPIGKIQLRIASHGGVSYHIRRTNSDLKADYFLSFVLGKVESNKGFYPNEYEIDEDLSIDDIIEIIENIIDEFVKKKYSILK